MVNDPKNLAEVTTYDTLERFLREFVNWQGDPVDYDFGGAFNFFDAILDNLARNHLDSDVESLHALGYSLTEPQRAFLEKLARPPGHSAAPHTGGV